MKGSRFTHYLLVRVRFDRVVNFAVARSSAARALRPKTKLFTRPMHDRHPCTMVIEAWPNLKAPPTEEAIEAQLEKDRLREARRLDKRLRLGTEYRNRKPLDRKRNIDELTGEPYQPPTPADRDS